MSDDVPSVKLPLPGSRGSMRPSAPAPSSMPISQSARTATAHDSESVNDDDWDSAAPESSEQASVSSTPQSQMPESSQRRVEAAREQSQPPDSVERPSDPSRTPTVRVSTRPQPITEAEAEAFNGLKEGLSRGTDDRTTLMGIAPFGASSSPPPRPVSSTPPAPTPTPSNRPYVWPALPPEVVAAQKALAVQARVEGAVKDEEPTKTEEPAKPVGQPALAAPAKLDAEQGERRDEAANEATPKAAEVTKGETVPAAGAQTTPPRNRRVATTDDAAFDASDRSSPPKPSRSSKPKLLIAAAVVLGAGGLWAAVQSSGTKSSSESESAVVAPKAISHPAPIKAGAPAHQPAQQTAQQPAPEPPQPVTPAPQPVSAELPVQPERAPTVATQAPTPEEAPSSGPTTRVVIRSKTKGAKFYRYGKEIGTDEITVDLPAGEKRAFELGLTGHGTRKVVIDGTRTEIEVGLRKIEGKPGSHTPSDL